eukprot:6534744-Karenia_brevis.AAC.1
MVEGFSNLDEVFVDKMYKTCNDPLALRELTGKQTLNYSLISPASMYIGKANLTRRNDAPGFVWRAMEHLRAYKQKGRDSSKPRYQLLRFLQHHKDCNGAYFLLGYRDGGFECRVHQHFSIAARRQCQGCTKQDSSKLNIFAKKS